MSEAYVFSTAEAPTSAEALDAALRSAGLSRRALAELVWLGSAPDDLPGDFPLLTLAENSTQAHLILQFMLRRLQAGERGLFALGQSRTEHAVCLILGGPAVVGRLNLLPGIRLYPAPPMPADPDDAAETFRISLTPPLQLEEPTPEDAPPPLLISPAMPPPPPPAMPEPPRIGLLLAEGGETPLFPQARRLPISTGLTALLSLLGALSVEEAWGGLVTPLARGFLVTLAEKL
jgi:hypothetical protein